jgi:hypothetical protein
LLRIIALLRAILLRLRLLGTFPVGALLLLPPDRLQGLALGLHANVAVMLEHLA